MRTSALPLVVWLAFLHLVNFSLPRLSTRPYPQPIDWLVLALVPAGALYASRYSLPRPLLLIYGMLGGGIFVTSYTARHMRYARFMTDLDKWTVIIECCAVTVAMGLFCRLAPSIVQVRVLLSRRPPWRCRGCGYDLTGNTSGICPECGRSIAAGPKPPPALTRASCGQLTFAENIDSNTREIIREMWINRLAGFRTLDLDRYLRDQTDQTRYTTGRLTINAKTFRRLSSLLFATRRLLRLTHLDLEADLLNAKVTRQNETYITRGRLILTIANRPVRQTQLEMTIDCRAARGYWHTAVENSPSHLRQA